MRPCSVQTTRFPDTVKQILCLGERVKLCFGPKSQGSRIVKGKRKKRLDNEFWEGIIVQPPFPNPGNLVIRVRRPINRDTPAYETLHDLRISAINSDQLPTGMGSSMEGIPLVNVYLKAGDGIKVAKRRVAAVNRISPSIKKAEKQKEKEWRREEEAESASSEDDVDTDAADIDDRDMLEIQKTMSTFPISSAPQSLEAFEHGRSKSDKAINMNIWQRDVVRGMSLSYLRDGNIPVVNYFHDNDPKWNLAVHEVLTPRQRTKLGDILASAPLGIVPVVGIPGGGKTYVLAAVAMLCLGSSDRNKLMCCAPTHAAADALASKLDVVSRKVVSVFNKNGQQRKHLPILIRAYHDQAEIETVLYMARNNGQLPDRDSSTWNTMRWSMSHSFTTS